MGDFLSMTAVSVYSMFTSPLVLGLAFLPDLPFSFGSVALGDLGSFLVVDFPRAGVFASSTFAGVGFVGVGFDGLSGLAGVGSTALDFDDLMPNMARLLWRIFLIKVIINALKL